MTPSCRTIVREILAKETTLNAWQWAEANIDYSRAPSYDSEWKGPYRIDYMPYLKEPMEACTVDGIKEVWMWACTRGGKSENLLLTVMRYMLACRPPYSILYMGAQEYKVAQFFQRRIVRGMQLSAATADRMKGANVSGCQIDFDGLCDFVAGWVTNRQIAKGDSYPVILADEVSSWPSFKADTLRERQATVAFPKLIGVSSADPESRRSSDEDPIIQEWEATDRREYMLPDPGAKGQTFQYVMGGANVPYGVKWSAGAKRDDGTWDMEIVENTAHYITPAGARIDEKDRMALCAEGVWVPTAKCMPSKRGYRVTRMMTPFPTGGFGNMARAFLEAKRKQDAGQFDEDGRSPMRVFMYERLAEKCYMAKQVPELSQIDARRTAYKRGERAADLPEFSPLCIGKKRITVLTVDVQKDHEWWVLREWVDGGDSSLIDFGTSHGLAELREIGVKAKVAAVLVDNSYEERAREFIESASGGVLRGTILCYGRDNIKDKHGNPQDYVVHSNKDPYEGTAHHGRFRVHSVTHHPDRMKQQLFALTQAIGHHVWRIPSDLPAAYAQQMTAEESIDGRWVRVRRANHIWDCEVLQLLAAKLFGLWRETETLTTPVPQPEAAPIPVQPAPVPRQTRAPDGPCPYCGKGPVVDQVCKACRAGVADSRRQGEWNQLDKGIDDDDRRSRQ